MRDPMTEDRLREAREVAWNPVYRPTPNFPEHIYRHDLFCDVVSEIERLRGTSASWRPAAAALYEILAEHRVMMQISRDQAGPPKLVTDLMQWVATTVECETHWQRERAEQAEAEAERLREQLGRTRLEFGVRLFDDEPVDATEAMGNREQAAELAAVWREEIENSNPTVMQRTMRDEGKWHEAGDDA